MFLDKRKREQKKAGRGGRTHPGRSQNRSASTADVFQRGSIWPPCGGLPGPSQDALEQFDKLRSVFDAAAYTGEYFQNRGLFSDYFLRDRISEKIPAWRDNPSEMFAFVRDLLRNKPPAHAGAARTRTRFAIRLLEPLFPAGSATNSPSIGPARTDQTQPDYLLKDGRRQQKVDGGVRLRLGPLA